MAETKVRKPWDQMTEAEQKEFLGPEYELLIKQKELVKKQIQAKQVREFAVRLISLANPEKDIMEDGKYAVRYSELGAELDAIWKKAVSDAEAHYGVTKK